MNRHIIIGWLGGDSEIFQCDFKRGEQMAKELEKISTWKAVYSGSLINLIEKLEPNAFVMIKVDER